MQPRQLKDEKLLLANIRDNIAILATQQNTTLEQIAHAIHREPDTLFGFVSGRTNVADVGLILDIATYFGYDLNSFLDLTPEYLMEKKPAEKPSLRQLGISSVQLGLDFLLLGGKVTKGGIEALTERKMDHLSKGKQKLSDIIVEDFLILPDLIQGLFKGYLKGAEPIVRHGDEFIHSLATINTQRINDVISSIEFINEFHARPLIIKAADELMEKTRQYFNLTEEEVDAVAECSGKILHSVGDSITIAHMSGAHLKGAAKFTGPIAEVTSEIIHHPGSHLVEKVMCGSGIALLKEAINTAVAVKVAEVAGLASSTTLTPAGGIIVAASVGIAGYNLTNMITEPLSHVAQEACHAIFNELNNDHYNTEVECARRKRLELEFTTSRAYKEENILHFLIRKGQVDILRSFIQKEDLKSENKDGQTPLHVAALRGKPDCIKVLLENANSKEEYINQLSNNEVGSTALQLASKIDNIECQWYLISQGADPERQDYKGKKAIDYAREEKSAISHRLLSLPYLEKSIHDCANLGGGIEHYAVFCNDSVLSKHILSQPGINLSAVDANGYTPFHYAAYYGDINCIKIMLDLVLNKIIPDDSKRNKDNDEYIKQAISILNTPNKQGVTPLSIAVMENQTKVIEYLCKNGDIANFAKTSPAVLQTTKDASPVPENIEIHSGEDTPIQEINELELAKDIASLQNKKQTLIEEITAFDKKVNEIESLNQQIEAEAKKLNQEIQSHNQRSQACKAATETAITQFKANLPKVKGWILYHYRKHKTRFNDKVNKRWHKHFNDFNNVTLPSIRAAHGFPPNYIPPSDAVYNELLKKMDDLKLKCEDSFPKLQNHQKQFIEQQNKLELKYQPFEFQQRIQLNQHEIPQQIQLNQSQGLQAIASTSKISQSLQENINKDQERIKRENAERCQASMNNAKKAYQPAIRQIARSGNVSSAGVFSRPSAGGSSFDCLDTINCSSGLPTPDIYCKPTGSNQDFTMFFSSTSSLKSQHPNATIRIVRGQGHFPNCNVNIRL